MQFFLRLATPLRRFLLGRRWRRTRRISFLSSLLLVALLSANGWFSGHLLGAVEFLEPFTVTPSNSAIQMTWITASEYDVERFDILCKEADEPSSAYHVIDSVAAIGGVDQEAAYERSFPASGFEAGQAYCFRLVEITTNNEPGDIYDRCGYGLNITPTPGLAPTITVPATPTIFSPLPTPTADLTATLLAALTTQPNTVAGTATFTPSPTLTPTETHTPTPTITPTPTFTLTPVQGQSALEEPTPTPSATVPITGTAGASGDTVVMTPTPTWTATLTGTIPTTDTIVPTAVPITLTPAITVTPALTGTPTSAGPITATVTATSTATLTGTDGLSGTGTLTETLPGTLTPVASAPVTATATLTPTITPTADEDAQANHISSLTEEQIAQLQQSVQQGTPQPTYLVFTATPASTSGQMSTPFTPIPSATATPPFNLAGLMAPSTENLMMMMLCMIFFGAGGLGILGLITSGLYMRSRSRTDRDL